MLTANTGIATAMTDARLALIRTAMITANKSIRGARIISRNDIMITSCTIFTSLVIRVVRDAELNLSILENENSCILLNKPFLSSAAKPTDACEEK